jgi:hypothetical protein
LPEDELKHFLEMAWTLGWVWAEQSEGTEEKDEAMLMADTNSVCWQLPSNTRGYILTSNLYL